jgi:DNA-binding winged helix-turn-helix (wHTH) protein
MVYVFGDYTLDMQRYELRRAKQRVALEPKAFDLLELEALISEATYGQLSTVYNQ